MGQVFVVPPDKLARAEVFLRRYRPAHFFAALLPLIRSSHFHPAGIVADGFLKFVSSTLTSGRCSACGLARRNVSRELTSRPVADADAISRRTKSQCFPRFVVGGAAGFASFYFVAMN